jgi:hypothetical protein
MRSYEECLLKRRNSDTDAYTHRNTVWKNTRRMPCEDGEQNDAWTSQGMPEI